VFELKPSNIDVVTMSGLEIAELTDKRHDNVMADIRAMLGGLNLAPLSFQGSYKDKNKQDRPCFHLTRDLTETLILGYSAPLRHAVVVRLRELEEQMAKPTPVANLNNPTTLRGLLLGYDHIRVSIDYFIERGVIQAPALQELKNASGQVSKVYDFSGIRASVTPSLWWFRTAQGL